MDVITFHTSGLSILFPSHMQRHMIKRYLEFENLFIFLKNYHIDFVHLLIIGKSSKFQKSWTSEIQKFKTCSLLENILRKTIEGYLHSVPSLTFNTIKTKLVMPAFHSSKYLISSSMFDLNQASIIKEQYMSNWCNPLY